ncbi:efflux RND transporter periplasmic adaptor subunit [Celeribacter marinus]|uniref:efflux RND transporter periplasmic adaptor subunit n=1 Tax=Celeribacter marinus TaxID=1397108 RepID=UPI003F6B8B69
MRIVPLLIAIIVSFALYFFVFQRDTLGEISGSTQPSVETTDATQAQADVNAMAPPANRDVTDKPVVKVVAEHSVAEVLDSAVILRGETQAARSVNVSAETSGRVVSAPLRKGSYVEEGQVMCQLDVGVRASSLAQAKAAVAEAEVGLRNAQKLAKGGYAAETNILTAEAGLERARAALAQTEQDIANLTIEAPFAGLLESDTAELGTLMQAGSICANVIQLDPMKLVAFAPEAEVDRIEVGTLASARLLTGTQITGRVTFLSRSADPTTRTFRVEIEVPNSDFAIRDGQTVEMAIRSEGKSAHLVKQSSLTLNDEGLLGVRIVDDAQMVAFMPIQVLRDTREGVWVAGLPERADIITVGQEYVRAGVPVEPHFEEIN